MAATQELLLGEGAGAPAVYIEDVFSTYLLSWSASTQTVTNGIDLTKGGLVWSKVRSVGTTDHCLNDSARNSFADRLVSNSAAAQNVNFSATEGVTAVSTTGFTYRTYSGYGSTYTYATWTFRKQPKFFDIVTYTGNNGSQTINHNLGSTPGCIIVKCATGADDWFVYHSSLGTSQYLKLDLTDAAATSAGFWGSVTSTSFGTTAALNANGQTYVAYLFASNAGGFGLAGTDNVISCGSFTNNSTVNLGYEPQLVLIKPSSTTGNWQIIDNMRGWVGTDAASSSALGGTYLAPNLSQAESTTAYNTNITPTGFKVDGITAGTYIYIAIRRGPMKVPTNGTTVYNTDTFRSTTANPNWKFNFVTDMSFSRVKNSAQDWSWKSRLTAATGLISNSTAAEYADANITWDFMDGVGKSTSAANPQNYGWGLKRAPSFFDVVCYTGTGTSNSAKPHNLGVAPELIIVKRRDTVENWPVYCQYIDATAPWNYSLGYLNSTGAKNTNSGLFGNQLPTSTNFYTAGNNTLVNTLGAIYVAYLFATCAGVSKVGSYTGTGTLTTINCGFTGGARFVMIKRTDTTSDWFVWDTSRGMVAGTDPMLPWNATTAEANANSVYTVATGFQLLASPSADVNTNGGSYIYLAIA